MRRATSSAGTDRLSAGGFMSGIRLRPMIAPGSVGHRYFGTGKVVTVTPFSRGNDVIKREFMLAQGFISIGANLERLQRRIPAVERSTARVRAELAEIRDPRESVADRQRESVSDAEPESQPADSEPTSPQNGFLRKSPSAARHALDSRRRTPWLPPFSSPGVASIPVMWISFRQNIQAVALGSPEPPAASPQSRIPNSAARIPNPAPRPPSHNLV